MIYYNREELIFLETKNRLKNLRIKHGYSRAKDFCEETGISFNTYQNYESGKRVPSTEFLVKIADFYGVSVDYLLGRVEDDNAEKLRDMTEMAELREYIAQEFLRLDDGEQRETLLIAKKKIDEIKAKKEQSA